MAGSKVFLNKGDLSDLINLLEEKNISKEGIIENINNNNARLLANHSDIKQLKKAISDLLIKETKDYVSGNFNTNKTDFNFIELKKNLFEMFYVFCARTVQKNYNFCLEKNDKYLFLDIVYDIFTKVKLSNVVDDFSKLSDEINTHGLNLKSLIVDDRNKSTILGKKIDSKNLSFLNYLLIFSKNEINIILDKAVKVFKKTRVIKKNKTLKVILKFFSEERRDSTETLEKIVEDREKKYSDY